MKAKNRAHKTMIENAKKMWEKEKPKVIEKYRKLLEQIIKDYISNKKILQSSQQSEWDSKLIPGWSEKLKNAKYTHLPNSGNYQNGIQAKYNETDSTIIVKNYAEPQPPIFTADPSSFTSETPLTDWIVNGKIHPLPPLGMWWKRDDWEEMYYDAYPYFDEIMKTSRMMSWRKNFTYELSKVYTSCLNKSIENYYSRRV